MAYAYSLKKGFIALTIVLMVSGILLALVAEEALDSGLFFDQATRKEYRAMNYYFAYDCIDRAAISYAHDYFYNPITPVSFPDFHCQIYSISKQGNDRVITTLGDYRGANVYRQATVRLHDTSVEIVSLLSTTP